MRNQDGLLGSYRRKQLIKSTSWSQGTFTHRFPITSGKHKFACAQCHTTPSYQVFTCLTCHGKADMDSKHRNRNGYRYDSLTCYGCHPTGRAG